MRRRFFLFAAPAIVAAPSLMRVSTLVEALAAAESPHYAWPPLSDLVSRTLRENSEAIYAQMLENNALLQMLEKQSGVTPLLLGGIDRSRRVFGENPT